MHFNSPCDNDSDWTNTERYLYFSLFLRSVLLQLLHFCWLECISTPHSWCFFCLQTLQGGGEVSWEDEKDCSLPTTCRSYERGPAVTTWSSVLTVVHYVDLNPNKQNHCCSQPTTCRSYERGPAVTTWSSVLTVVHYVDLNPNKQNHCCSQPTVQKLWGETTHSNLELYLECSSLLWNKNDCQRSKTRSRHTRGSKLRYLLDPDAVWLFSCHLSVVL